MMALFERLARDRNGVVEFVGEATGIVKQLSAAGATRDVERRLVHTLKGNSALMGLKDLSGLCHDVESGMLAEQRGLSLEDRVQIRTAWSTTAEKIGRFLHVNDGQMQVPRADYEALRDALVSEGHPLARELQMWDLEPLEARYLRIAEQARELATRLGKAPVRVEIDPGGIRTHTETWAAFWSAFVHAVRNAIDHGLETREDRAAQGKGIGTLSLRTYFSDSSLVIDFSDDGKGIAWERVREKAQAAGLPSESREDLVAALFRDGISTKERADELSGRGVGMAALAQACAAMGGTIQVESEAGRGTMWRFSFPRELG